MRRSHRILLPVLAAAMLAIPQAASAAPDSSSFAVKGIEYAFTRTVGTFAGIGTGDEGDRAAWNTSVEHGPLDGGLASITGGTFQMITDGPDLVRGDYRGGTISTIDPGANCTKQRYLVAGSLENIVTSDTSAGTGTFSVTLTHHRTRVFGRCVTYSATVDGVASFAF